MRRKLKQGKYYYNFNSNIYGVTQDLKCVINNDFKKIPLTDNEFNYVEKDKFYYIIPFFYEDFVDNVPKMTTEEHRELIWGCDRYNSYDAYRNVYGEIKNLMGDVFYKNLFGDDWKVVYKGPQVLDFQEECYKKTFKFAPGQIIKFNAPNITGCSLDFEIIKPYSVPEIGQLNSSNRLQINNKGAEIDGNDLLDKYHKLKYFFIGRIRANDKTYEGIKDLRIRKSVLTNINGKGESFYLENCKLIDCSFDSTESCEIRDCSINNCSFSNVGRDVALYIPNRKTVSFNKLYSPKGIEINVDKPENFAIKIVSTKMFRVKYKCYNNYYTPNDCLKIYIDQFIIPKDCKNIFISGTHQIPTIIIKSLSKEDPSLQVKLRVNNAKVSIGGTQMPDGKVQIV